MRKIIIALAALLFLSVVVVGGQMSSTFQAGPPVMKGYFTVGNTLVVLPHQLKSGDELIFTNMLGESVLKQRVEMGYFSVNSSKLLTGLYVITLKRNGVTLAAVKVPLLV
jgi:hypothetical protein